MAAVRDGGRVIVGGVWGRGDRCGVVAGGAELANYCKTQLPRENTNVKDQVIN